MKNRDFFEEIAANWDSWESPETFQAMEKMVKRFNLPASSLILDIGCGTGNIIQFMKKAQPKSYFMGIDYAFNMLKQAYLKISATTNTALTNHTLLCADATQSPFRNNCFERLICFSCFPHFQDKKAALREFYRLLKPNGLLYIAHISPSYEINKLHNQINGTVKNDILPTATEMQELLQESCFSQISIYDNDFYLATACKSTI